MDNITKIDRIISKKSIIEKASQDFQNLFDNNVFTVDDLPVDELYHGYSDYITSYNRYDPKEWIRQNLTTSPSIHSFAFSNTSETALTADGVLVTYLNGNVRHIPLTLSPIFLSALMDVINEKVAA
jgi:hypothetical protein